MKVAPRPLAFGHAPRHRVRSTLALVLVAAWCVGFFGLGHGRVRPAAVAFLVVALVVARVATVAHRHHVRRAERWIRSGRAPQRSVTVCRLGKTL